MSNSQARVEEVFAEAARLFATKNATYQDSWRTQGWRGNLSRILEKAGRLRAMLWRGGNVLLNGSKEHPRETLLDIINTASFLIINMDDGVEWGHEPQAKEINPPVDYGPVPGSYEEALQRQRQSGVGEQTIVTPVVGEVPPPGEERPSPKPRKRATVTDRGSGPRPAVDNPQA